MAAEILVVDDEADIRELVGGILEDEGYPVKTAGNSTDALAAVRTRAPVFRSRLRACATSTRTRCASA